MLINVVPQEKIVDSENSIPASQLLMLFNLSFTDKDERPSLLYISNILTKLLTAENIGTVKVKKDGSFYTPVDKESEKIIYALVCLYDTYKYKFVSGDMMIALDDLIAIPFSDFLYKLDHKIHIEHLEKYELIHKIINEYSIPIKLKD